MVFDINNIGSIIENTTPKMITKRYNKEDFEKAFFIIAGIENSKDITSIISEFSFKIQILVLGIYELAQKYDVELKTDDFNDKLFQKLNKSNCFKDIGIGNLVYNIINGSRDCNNCKIVEKYSLLRKQATTDLLTGLYNRTPLEEKIKKYINIKKKHGTNSCILMIDIDNFKHINDGYGHAKGDEVLIEVSKLFKLNLRLEDIVGRWGGEEFLIILPSTNITDGKIVANKIRESIAANLNKEVEIDKTITISIGITEILESDETGKKAQDRADIALYESKNNGRNMVSSNLINPGEERKRRKED